MFFFFGTIQIIIYFLAWTCDGYLIGSGLSDVTGPAAEINMMGYAVMSQKSYGINLRLFSRAFVVADETNPSNLIVFVSVDCGMISQNVKTKVISELRKKSTLFTEKNVVLSATHTHSGPGGFHQYLLFDVTSLGFVEQSFEALVTGIVKSIEIAHSRLTPGKIFTSAGDLLNSNINRSPTSYLRNPAEERAKYDGDTDVEMTLLKFVTNRGHEIGTINWFPVHGTSMNNTNGYISGDNKGYASQLFERAKNGKNWPFNVTFVAAFAQANEGDVSPNTAGPRCLDTGLPCDILTSTCNGKAKNCVAFGPGKDMFESMQIIGRRQYERAESLYNVAEEEVTGKLGFAHQYVNMSGYTVTFPNGTKTQTCPPAMGYSFAAGTTDGPGDFDFTQGTVKGNPFWNFVSSLIKKASSQQKACHHPKPILLNTGEMSRPYKWQADIVETQILRIGSFLIAAVPGEFTTMSGRRMKAAINEAASEYERTTTVIAGLSNTYSDYITTFEEYQAQRYEAGSTIYGPHTLAAYVQQYSTLAKSLYPATDDLPSGPSPPYYFSQLLSFVPPVLYDHAPIGKTFGQVLKQPNAAYQKHQTVTAVMVSANPRNNLLLGSSFMDVEYFDEIGHEWITVLTDAHWETKFKWYRTGFISDLFGYSEVELSWTITGDVKPGQYRLRHRGYYKHWYIIKSSIYPFDGVTNQFTVQ